MTAAYCAKKLAIRKAIRKCNLIFHRTAATALDGVKLLSIMRKLGTAAAVLEDHLAAEYCAQKLAIRNTLALEQRWLRHG